RSLHLWTAGLGTDELRTLLQSANVRRLVWLGVKVADSPDGSPSVPPDLAEDFTHLPYLASLSLLGRRLDPRTRGILTKSDSIAWTSLPHDSAKNSPAYRTCFAPDQTPPLDAWEEGAEFLETC